MKAIRIHSFGGPEVLELEEVPELNPGPDQILVRIHAAGVNPADTYARTGNYAVQSGLPFTPGTDGAGVVESVGTKITKFKPGDRVYLGRTVTGTYAEYALALESQVHLLPAKVSFKEGAGVFVPYGTAFHALHHSVKACGGETVLIHGGSGGVGTAAIQMALAMGLKILATAGSEKGIELIKKEGAHIVFDHSVPGYQDDILKSTDGKGVDIILEMMANVNLGPDLRLIGRNGSIVVIGSRGETTVNPRDLMFRRGSVIGMMLWNITDREASEIEAGIYAGLENGTLRPVIGKELPLSKAVSAHKKIMEPGSYGKIVLIP